MRGLTIRRAQRSDAAAIAGIYNHYVLNTTVTFDEVPKSAEDRETWLAASDERHPVLIAEKDGQVVGWGALTRFRERAAWSETAEAAVYLAPDATGRGIGPELLGELIRAADRAGLHALISQISADNEPSVKMTERMGFERVGVMREVGWKFGAWLDVIVLELLLPQSPAEEPE